MSAGPYADAAAIYQRLGWSPLPLPLGKKYPPPTGWTGYAAPMASGADVHAWAGGPLGCGNVGVRPPKDVIGLDVDAYGGKPGEATMLAAVDRLGPLPPTWRSTSRGPADPSGIRFYRVPEGRRCADTLGPGVDSIHNGLRYAMVAPSVHPEGRGYRWYGPDGSPVAAPPAVSDLPYLPDAWVDELDAGDVGDRPGKADVLAAEVHAWLAALPTGDPCQYVTRLIGEAGAALAGNASRHDAARTYVARMIRAGDQGHGGAVAGLDTIESLWRTSLRRGSPRDPDRGEWDRMVTGAVAMAVKAPTDVMDKGCCRAEAPTSVLAEGRAEPPGTDDDDPTGPGPGATWHPLDLTDVIAGLMAGTITRHAPSVGRRDDGAALFYPGKVNGVAGASGSGKTWTALVSAVQELDAGHHVVYVDLEDDAAGVVGRVLDLGADPEAVGARFHYVSPDESYGIDARQSLEAVVGRVEASLVVIDSTGESMALDGAKPNDDDDTARWFRRLPTALARLGPAVVVLDHVVKADDGGLWPIGSQRKRAAINGAQYMQSTVRPFARDTAGAAKLVCAKDRHGNYRPGQKVAELAVTPHEDGVNAVLVPPGERAEGGNGFRPTSLMEKVSRALADAGPDGLSVRGIEGLRLGKKEAVALAVDVLAAEDYLTRTPGPRNAIMHTTARAYRQADDPRSDAYESAGGQSGPGVHPRGVSDCPRPLDRGTGDSQTTVPGGRSGDGRGTVVAPPLPAPHRPPAPTGRDAIWWLTGRDETDPGAGAVAADPAPCGLCGGDNPDYLTRLYCSACWRVTATPKDHHAHHGPERTTA